MKMPKIIRKSFHRNRGPFIIKVTTNKLHKINLPSKNSTGIHYIRSFRETNILSNQDSALWFIGASQAHADVHFEPIAAPQGANLHEGQRPEHIVQQHEHSLVAE